MELYRSINFGTSCCWYSTLLSDLLAEISWSGELKDEDIYEKERSMDMAQIISGKRLPSRSREIFKQHALLASVRRRYRQMTLSSAVARLLSAGANPNLYMIPCQLQPTKDGRFLAECLVSRILHPHSSMNIYSFTTEFQNQILILLIRHGLRTIEYLKQIRFGRVVGDDNVFRTLSGLLRHSNSMAPVTQSKTHHYERLSAELDAF